MATNAEKAYDQMKAAVGDAEGTGEWFEIDQPRINAFAEVTIDHQFIHVDPEKAAQLSPYKVPIAHGFLTLSMLTHLAGSLPRKPEWFEGVVMGINYGFDKVRFISPVKVNSRVRVASVLSDVQLKDPNTIQMTRTMTIEIEGEDRPACVAEWVTRTIYG
ncbi:MAG: MaoC family dehydratase [Acidimicrobiales bacterium]